jgi:signal transduction histidine kinase/CheY-like chemotaxis protein
MGKKSGKNPSVNLSGYVLAGVLSGLALAGAWLSYPVFGDAVFSVFYVVVIIVAWQGGLGPAILAMVIGIVAIMPLLVPPLGIAGLGAEDLLPALAFLATSAVIALITGSRESTHRALAESLAAERQHEARILAMMDSTAEALVLLSPEGKVLDINEMVQEMFGISAEVAVGRHVEELRPGSEQVFADPARFFDLVARTIEDAEGYHTESLVQNWPKPRELEVFSAPVCGGDCDIGAHYGRLYVFRDVTHQREVDRMKNEFVSLVSHELRTPLTSIKGFTDMILEGDAGEINEEVEEFLEIVQSNANRLVALINDLLDISRIESGRIQLKVEPVDLGSVVAEVVAVMQPQLDEKRQSLTVVLDPALSLVRGDRDKLVQVVTNYVSNAHKYTPEGGRIQIETSRVGDLCQLAVIDNGFGIASEDQKKLFMRFYRVDSSLTSEIGGTGLGLSIVKSIIEMHGGWVGVESEPDKGSKFFFTVPLAADATDDGAGTEPAKEVAATRALSEPASVVPAAPTPAGGRILVVEDNPEISRLICAKLEGAGYKVTAAISADTALEAIAQQVPDLITVDMELPGTGNLGLARQLAESPDTHDIPIVVLSVLNDDRDNPQFGLSPLPKPVDEDELLRTMARELEGASKRQVLVIEDDSDTRELLRVALEKNGFEAVVAADGEAGLLMASQDVPGLILLDLRLPGMDGFSVLQALKQDEGTSEIPVIVMTGSESFRVGARARVLSLGAADFVSKPFDLNMLIAEIRVFIQQREEA